METSPRFWTIVNPDHVEFRQIWPPQSPAFLMSRWHHLHCVFRGQLQAKHGESTIRWLQILAAGANLHFPPTAIVADHSRTAFAVGRTYNRKNRKVCAKWTSIRSILRGLFCLGHNGRRPSDQVSGINSSDASCFCDAQHRGLNYD